MGNASSAVGTYSCEASNAERWRPIEGVLICVECADGASLMSARELGDCCLPPKIPPGLSMLLLLLLLLLPESPKPMLENSSKSANPNELASYATDVNSRDAFLVDFFAPSSMYVASPLNADAERRCGFTFTVMACASHFVTKSSALMPNLRQRWAPSLGRERSTNCIHKACAQRRELSKGTEHLVLASKHTFKARRVAIERIACARHGVFETALRHVRHDEETLVMDS